MKSLIKAVLKSLHIYHPLHFFYRGVIGYCTKKYYQFAYAKYKGSGFTCNFCNASYTHFVPEYPFESIAAAISDNQVIAGYGENVFCPNCMSKNRERLLLAVIEDQLDINGKKVLHFSPEQKLYDRIKIKAQVTTVDIAPDFYRNIDRNIKQADATKLAFADGRFEMIIANHILEHIPDDMQALREMLRVLQPGGLAILQVPYSNTLLHTIEDVTISDPEKQERLYGQKDHVRIYALHDYLQRLLLAGFSVRRLTGDALAAYRKYAIQENEDVFLCYKSCS